MTGLSSFLHRPRKSAENVIGGASVILAAVVIAAGFGATPARTVSVTGFHQTGTFSYSAKTLHPSPAYPDRTAKSGQPIYLSVIRDMSVAFSYRFESKLRSQGARHRDAEGAPLLDRQLATSLHARNDKGVQRRHDARRRYLRPASAAGRDRPDFG